MSPRRSPWKKKRWIAALALWIALPVLYALSDGPACYCVARGWLTEDAYAAVYGPILRLLAKVETETGSTWLSDQTAEYAGLWGQAGIHDRDAALD